MVHLGSYLMDTYNDIFTSYYSSQVIIDYILSDLDAYLLLEDEVIYDQVDVISTDGIRRCRCYSLDRSSSTCYLQVMLSRQPLNRMSPSPMYVNIQGYACSNLRT